MTERKKKIGRPKVADKKGIVSFTARASKIAKARNKKGVRALSRYLEQALYDYIGG